MSLGLKRGERHRASTVTNEAGLLGLRLQKPAKIEPVYLDSELTEYDLARVLDPDFEGGSMIPLDPPPDGWILTTAPLGKSCFMHQATRRSVVVGDQVLPNGAFCRTMTLSLGSGIQGAADHLWRVGCAFFGAGETVYAVARAAVKGVQSLFLIQVLDGSVVDGAEADALVIEPAALEAFARRIAGN